jgi:sucrose phosphorylase
MTIRNQIQLITYPDSLGGDLKALNEILNRRFSDIFKGGVHLLPPYPSSGDRGFAPISYFEIDPQFGSWQDIRKLSERFDLLVDLMVNHISRRSVYFQDFQKKGRRSPYADLFLTLDKVWPGGVPDPQDVAKIFLRRPEHPFADIAIEETGEIERVWATFGTRDWSEQIDLDVNSPAARKLLTEILEHLGQQGIKMVRLDAVGYVIKKPGTSCFMVEPEIYAFLEWIETQARLAGIELLLEVHDHISTQLRLAGHGYWVYNFVLPLLVLHTLLNRSSHALQDHLKVCPRRQFTMLDCHDGIPVLPDIEDVLDLEAARRVVEACLQRGANLNRILSDEHKGPGGFDAHQINCTYYSALGNDDDAYISARAIQFFAPGVPQVYYVGLLAGENDPAAVEQTGEGRAINRHNYSTEEVERDLNKPVVQRLLRLMRFRNEFPAFNGDFEVLPSPEQELRLAWQMGEQCCRLHVDLLTGRSRIEYRDAQGNTGVFEP